MIAGSFPLFERSLILAEMTPWADAVAQPAWLSRGECETLATMRDSARRLAWLAGRWLAKSLVCDVCQCEAATLSRGFVPKVEDTESLTSIEIYSRNGREQGVAPLIFVHGQWMPWTLTLTHDDQTAWAVLATRPGMRIGVDSVALERSQPEWIKSWLTAKERFQAAESTDRDCLATIWAAKEAAYKALQEGESFAPLQIEITLTSAGAAQAVWSLLHEVRNCSVRLHRNELQVRAFAAAGMICPAPFGPRFSRQDSDLLHLAEIHGKH